LEHSNFVAAENDASNCGTVPHFGTNSLLVAVGLAAICVFQEEIPRQRPVLTIDSAPYRHPGKAASVRALDFKNLKYPVAANLAFQLRNGKLHKDVPSYTDVTLRNVWYFDSRALVVLDLLSCGGSCSDQSWLYLFAIENGHLTIQQQFMTCRLKAQASSSIPSQEH
jgi:hypothetical protein